ncbi:hypothetical protein PG993_008784 [Apiospora rasikravindrae]|uniref:Heterokaryon incompatibility domain-containing protein n=1 Tax=Apiospora rasikravindrae TaxID=990691 RepID=A0ABR1SR25_9PEZI
MHIKPYHPWLQANLATQSGRSAANSDNVVFHEDIREGGAWQKELPYWQEELPFSINGLDYSPSRNTIWYPQERPVDWDFRPKSVSPHGLWRAEVDWQAFVGLGPEQHCTVWEGEMGAYLNDDRPFYESKRKPMSPPFRRAGRRDSIHGIPFTTPSSPSFTTTGSDDSDTWHIPKMVFDDVPPAKDFCEACRRINPQSLKRGLRHHDLRTLFDTTYHCAICLKISTALGSTWLLDNANQSFDVILDDSVVRAVDSNNGNIVKQGKEIRTWYVFTNEFDPAVDYGIKYRQRLTTTKSDESFVVARGWLKECVLSHRCGRTPERDTELSPSKLVPKLPRRLIDLRSEACRPEEVVLAQPQPSETYHYAALSYCWGQGQGAAWLTTKANLNSRTKGFARSSLPKTLLDALFITEKLGLRYIWIDALCIVQDDKDDWESEGSQMGGIYAGSQITISASSSSPSYDGIFDTHSTTRLAGKGLGRIDCELSDGRQSQLYFETSPGYSLMWLLCSHLRSGPLSRRAWCFQERALSPRNLYYTDCQLLWQCEHGLKTEDGLDRLWMTPKIREETKVFPTGLAARPLSTEDVIRVWYGTTVPAYTRGKLTYDGDKLVAISALAEAIHANCNDDYLAGLWRNSIISGLLWQRDGPGAKTTTYRCPSWSWASQNSRVAYPFPKALFRGSGESTFHCEVLNAEVKAGKHNAFGSVESGSVRLKVSLISTWVWKKSIYSGYSLALWDGTRPIVIPAIMDDESWQGGPVVCAYIAVERLLILRHVKQASNIYKRVGIGNWSHEVPSGWTHGWREEPTELWERRILQAIPRTDITIL